MRLDANIYLQNTVEDILNSFGEVLPDGMGELASVEGISALGIDKLLAELAELATGSLGSVLPFLLFIIGANMLVGLTSLCSPGMARGASTAAGAVLSLAVLVSLYPAVSAAVDALSELSDFFGALIPVVTSIPLLGGGSSTGAAAGAGMQLTLWIMGIASGSLLPSVVVAMLATSGLGGSAVGELARGFGRLFTRIMGILTAALAGVVALQTFISASADSATMRLAKYAATDAIPVVGNAVSGALATLAGGLSYAGSIVGAGSVAAILGITLSPLVILLSYRLAFGVAGALGGVISGGVSHISGISSALDALISVYVMTIVIYIFDIIAVIIGGARIIG